MTINNKFNKKHAIAMALSAISAGLIISCTKPVDENKTNETPNKDVNVAAKEGSASANNGQNTQPNTKPTQNDDLVTTKPTDKVSSGEDTTQAVVSPEAQKTYLTHVADDLIIITYHDAARQAQALHDIASKHCQAAPVTGTPLLEMRGQWIKLAQAWAAAEMVNFGPATQSMSNLYINYYPDERGMVRAGVADLIKNSPNITPDELATQSAIVQGVPGLEEALFANDSLNKAQCAYVISASAALNTRLQTIEKTWRENANSLLAIDQTASSDLGLNQWLNSLLSYIETLKASAVEQPLGLSGNAKGHVPAVTAGQSGAIINAKLATLDKALTDPELLALLSNKLPADGSNNRDNDNSVSGVDPSKTAVGTKLSAALADTRTQLAKMPADISKADKAQQQQLYGNLTQITKLIKQELIPALGVRVGFNSTDGD